MPGPTIWVSHRLPPLTHHHPTSITSSPLETGKYLSRLCIIWNKSLIIELFFAWLGFVPASGLRCRTLVSPMRLRWRASHWSLIFSIPAKQRLRCLSQLSNHLTGKNFSFSSWIMLLASFALHFTGMTSAGCADSILIYYVEQIELSFYSHKLPCTTCD